MKAAVIGVGKMGLVHASVLNTLPNIELIAFCDKSASKVSFTPKKSEEI